MIEILKDFTKGKIDKLNNISDLTGKELFEFLDSLTTQNSSFLFLRGNVTESIIKNSIYLKYPEFNKYKLYQGKIRNRKQVKSLKDIYGGTSKGGEVDIIMENDEEIFVISSKVKNELTWKETEIREMFYSVELYFQENKELNKKRRYGVIIKDKNSQLLKDSGYIKEIKRKFNLEIYDYNDLYKMWDYIMKVFKEYNFDVDKIDEVFGDTEKIKLELFPHQKYLYNEFKRKVEEEKHNIILLYNKPRSGKTFLTLYSLKELERTRNIKTVLLITYYPSLNYQWKEVIERYVDFKNWNLVVSNSEKELILDENKVNFVMISYQELVKDKNYLNKEKFQNIKILNKDNKIEKTVPLKDVKWDVVVWDEVHISAETENGKIIRETILNYDLFISLSATPEKNFMFGSFNDDNTIPWTEIDEYEAKIGEHRKLLELGYTKEELIKLYGNIPTFNYFIIDVDEELRKTIKNYEKEIDDKYLFTMNKLFLNEWLRNDGLTTITDMLFGSNMMDFRNKGLLWKINKNNSKMDKMTFLFFVNSKRKDDEETKIDLQEILKEYLLKNEVVKKVFGEHSIHIVNSKITDSSNILNYVNLLEYNKFGSQKYRIIILIDQLRTGITLSDVSTVVLMDDTSSYQKIKQTSYRSQSPYKNKKVANVVDLNPYRTYDPLRILQLTNQMFEKNEGDDEKDRELIYKLINDSINIFTYDFEKYTLRRIDYHEYNKMYSKKLQHDLNSIHKLMNIARELVSRDRNIIKYLETSKIVQTNLFDEFDINLDKTQINDLVDKKGKDFEIKYVESKKTNKRKLKSSIEKKLFSILFGLLRMSMIFDFENVNEFNNFFKEMSFYLKQKGETNNMNSNQLKLFDFKEKYPNMEYQLENIKNKWGISKETVLKELTELFQEYLGVNIEENPEILNLINNFLKEDNFSQTFDEHLNIVKLIKSEKPEKIEELTKGSEYLKKVKGEVFTPLKGVVRTLQFLPDDVWTNPNLKWLDPSNGSGNFLYVIYEILMGNGEKYGFDTIGLKETIPDEEKRRKHIIENMLYGFELQLKNIIVSKLRLNPEGIYKDNIIHGDFFKLIENPEFQNKFDIIIGNPPYQYKDKSTVNTVRSLKGYKSLYDKFILLSIDKLLKDNGYLLFIIPSGWKTKHELIKFILNNGVIKKVETTNHTMFNIPIDILYFKKDTKDTSETIIHNYTSEISSEINLKETYGLFEYIPNYVDNIIIDIFSRMKKFYNENLYINLKTTSKKKRKDIKFDVGIVLRDNRDFKPMRIKDFKSENNFDGIERTWLIPLNNKEEETELITLIEKFDKELKIFSMLSKTSPQHRNRKTFEIIFNYLLFNKINSFSKKESEHLTFIYNRIISLKRKGNI